MKKLGVWTVVMVLFLLSLSLVNAQEQTQPPKDYSGGIVECGNDPSDPCTYEDLLGEGGILNNIIKIVVFQVGIPISVIFLMYGGVLMVISGGDKSKIEKGRSIIRSTVVGYALILSAWLIVDTVLNLIFST